MDPDTVLTDLRELVAMYRDGDVADELVWAEQIAENVAALDEWLSKGGHAPSAWPLVVMAR